MFNTTKGMKIIWTKMIDAVAEECLNSVAVPKND